MQWLEVLIAWLRGCGLLYTVEAEVIIFSNDGGIDR